MKSACIGLLLIAAWAPPAFAQIPGIPGVGGIPSVPGGGIPAVPGAGGIPGAAGGKTIWSCLGLSAASLAACRSKLCQSQLGALLNGGLTPLSALSGGVMPSLCPPTLSPIAPGSDPNGAESVANKIKKDEADAKARVAAIEYLGTVDCHYWPEAEKALISGLRADRNECVRFAAARVLGSGCCCTKKTIAALALTATGSKEDGNPSEDSPRVRATAFDSLNRCSCKGIESEPVPSVRPEYPTRPESPPAADAPTILEPLGGTWRDYYDRKIAAMPASQVLAGARHALAVMSQQGIPGADSMITGRRSLAGAVTVAAAPRAVAAGPAPTPPRGDPSASRASLRRDPAIKPAATSRPEKSEAATGHRSLLQIVRQSREERGS